MEPADNSESASDGWTDWTPPALDNGPPQQTLDWLEEQLGAGVTDAEPLVGGLSSAVHRLTLTDGRRVVVRRHTNAPWMAREPNIPFDEMRILTLLGDIDIDIDIDTDTSTSTSTGTGTGTGTGTDIATPTLIAADPAAERCDVPTVLMTEVPGQPMVNPATPSSWAEQLAECLAGIHRTPLPDGLTDYGRWDHHDAPVPTWIEDADRWRQAKAMVAGPLAFDLATLLSAPAGPFPTQAWNALGRDDLTSAVVATRIEAWLVYLMENADG